MRLTVIIAILLLPAITYCQYTIIPTGTTETLADFHTEGDFILIVGGLNYLGKCHGDCDDLSQFSSPTPSGYSQKDLSLIDTNTYGIISFTSFPHHGMVYVTEDGGSNWTKILDTADYYFRNSVMFDKDTGCVVSTFYKSLWTGDFGTNWNNVSHGLVISTKLKRLNDSTAIMGTTEKFAYTTNKGLNWSGDPGFVQSPPRAFFANNLDTVYAVCAGGTGLYLTYTFDLVGSNWFDEFLPPFYPFGVCAKNWDEIYVLGADIADTSYTILKTTDLGNTWSSFDLGMQGAFSDMHFLNDSIALVCGEHGLLIRLNVNSIDFETLAVKEFTSKSNSLQIFPNPVSDQINLNQKIADIDRIEIRDLNGNMILVTKSFPIDVSKFSAGTYLISVLGSNDLYQNKFIKL